MSQNFPKPYEPFGRDVNVKVYLSNYATKTDLKNVSQVVVSSFALKSNLASLKTEVDKLDIDKLTPVPNDLAKLSNVVKNDAVKKTEYNKLVTKIDNIDTTNFVKENKYEKDGSDFEDKINKVDKKISDVSSLVKKTDFNTKVTETEGKRPNVSGFLLTSVFNSKITEVENKIPDSKNLAKNDYVTNAALDARHKDLVQKTTFKSELKKVDDKASANSSKVLSYKHKLKQRENTINDLERDASYFRGKNCFDGNGTQNHLVFQGVYKYFEDVDVSKTINKFHANSWISKGLSDKKISSVSWFTRPFIEYTNARIKLKFDGSILREKLSTSLGLIANYYMVNTLNPRTNSSNVVLENCLFGKIKMKKMLTQTNINTYVMD